MTGGAEAGPNTAAATAACIVVFLDELIAAVIVLVVIVVVDVVVAFPIESATPVGVFGGPSEAEAEDLSNVYGRREKEGDIGIHKSGMASARDSSFLRRRLLLS